MQESYVEIQTQHLPNLLRHISSSMASHCASLGDSELILCFKLCSDILSRVEPSMAPVYDAQSPLSSAASSPVKRAVARSITEAQRRAMDDVLDGKPLTADDAELAEEATATAGHPQTSAAKAKRKLADSGTAAVADGRGDVLLDDTTDDDDDDTSHADTISSLGSSQAETVMQACLHSYKHLFCVFVSTRVVTDRDLALKLAQDLVISDVRASTTYQRDACAAQPAHDVCPAGGISEQSCDAFQQACRLLIDFSAFPLFCSDSQRALKESFKIGWCYLIRVLIDIKSKPICTRCTQIQDDTLFTSFNSVVLLKHLRSRRFVRDIARVVSPAAHVLLSRDQLPRTSKCNQHGVRSAVLDAKC